MLTRLTKIREYLLIAYHKAGFAIVPVVRFVVALLSLEGITAAVGGDPRFSGTAVILVAAAVCAVLPSGFTVLIMMAFSLIHILALSMVTAAMTLIAYVIMYGLMLRFAPRYSIVAVLVPLLGRFGLHYAVPIILACTASPIAVLPMLCGVFVFGMTDAVRAASAREVGKNLDLIIELCKELMDVVLANRPMFAMMAVFVAVFAVVYVIRKCSFDNSLYIAVAAGVSVNVVGFLIAGLGLHYDVNIGMMLLMSIVSGVLGIAYEFSKRALDYNRSEYCSFEDEDYYYFVKAVPKIHAGEQRRDPLTVADGAVRMWDNGAGANTATVPLRMNTADVPAAKIAKKVTEVKEVKKNTTDEYDESDLKGDD